jgi:hypothetical protein
LRAGSTPLSEGGLTRGDARDAFGVGGLGGGQRLGSSQRVLSRRSRRRRRQRVAVGVESVAVGVESLPVGA